MRRRSTKEAIKRVSEELKQGEVVAKFGEIPKRRRRRRLQKLPKKSEYLWAAFVNIVLLYFFNHLSEWHIDFLTNRFALCLPAINLSVGASVFGNFLFLFCSKARFHSIVHTVMNLLLTISLFSVYKVFPFSFPQFLSFNINLAVRAILLLTTAGAGVATILEFLEWVLAPREGKC